MQFSQTTLQISPGKIQIDQLFDLNALGKNRNSLFTALLQTDRLRNDRSFGHHDDSKMFGLFLFTSAKGIAQF